MYRLRRQVEWRPGTRSDPSHRRTCGKSKVRKLALLLIIQKDVCRFDVSVHVPLLVSVLQTAKCLTEDMFDSSQFDRLLRKKTFQAAARDVLHSNEYFVGGHVASVMNCNNIRVLELY